MDLTMVGCFSGLGSLFLFLGAVASFTNGCFLYKEEGEKDEEILLTGHLVASIRNEMTDVKY